MPKYYNAKEDADGNYVSANHTRYSVIETDFADVYIPVGRQSEMPAYDSIEDFLPTIGLERVEVHTFPVPEPTAEELQARIIEGAFAAASAVYDSLPKGKQALWDQVRLAVHAAILAGDLAGAREILETVPIIYPDMPADRDSFLAIFPV
jgi:hypothetical protein